MTFCRPPWWMWLISHSQDLQGIVSRSFDIVFGAKESTVGREGHFCTSQGIILSLHFSTSLYGAVQYSGVTWRTKPSFDEFMMMQSNLVFNRIQPVSLRAAIVPAWINFNCSRMFACRLWFMKCQRLTIIRWPKWKQRWNGTPVGLIVCNEVVLWRCNGLLRGRVDM